MQCAAVLVRPCQVDLGSSPASGTLLHFTLVCLTLTFTVMISKKIRCLPDPQKNISFLCSRILSDDLGVMKSGFEVVPTLIRS